MQALPAQALKRHLAPRPLHKGRKQRPLLCAAKLEHALRAHVQEAQALKRGIRLAQRGQGDVFVSCHLIVHCGSFLIP